MNTVEVVFQDYLHTAVALSELWQWDYGQRLVIIGLALPDTYEVHFCNQGDSESIIEDGDESGVSIPDELLETGRNIRAYIYLHNGKDDGETKFEITVKVHPRAKPSKIRSGVTNPYISMVSDYATLANLPKINGKTLLGEMSGETLGLVSAEELTEALSQQADGLSIPNGCDIEDDGIMVFKHGATELFTVQLPIWDGGMHNEP